ncbi:MAG: RsmG family class I SAM-dependent methyltransferase [Acidimicrobiales bacterium]
MGDTGASAPDALTRVLTEARSAGFLGPGALEPHLRHAAGFTDLARRLPLPPGAAPRLLDLGSGGGLPGLVLGVDWPEATLVLLDANERRAEFLRRAVLRCGLESRVCVVQGRAEVCGRDRAYRGNFDGVVARAFGPPGVVAECAAPFLRPGGWLIVSEPPVGAGEEEGTESRWPPDRLSVLGLESGEPVRQEFGYQVLYQREPCPERFPRRNGVPAKHPLF